MADTSGISNKSNESNKSDKLEQEIISLQEKYAPENACFGCGPKNKDGLQLKSFPKDGEVVASFMPEKKYEAFPGVLNGGIVGALLDCHSNWTAAYRLMQHLNETVPPCTVTAEYTIKLLRPTPTDQLLHLTANVVKISDKDALVEAKLLADGKVTATSSGRFVVVKPGHPGYYRW